MTQAVELHQGIKHAAKERGTSEAELIRTAVRHELLGAPADQQERAQRRGRLLAAMGKLDSSAYPPPAEILVGPARVDGKTLKAARDFADGCETVPVSAAIADDAAALKARHRSLSLPDAIALVLAEMIDADAVWTFDRRWRDVHQRVTIP